MKADIFSKDFLQLRLHKSYNGDYKLWVQQINHQETKLQEYLSNYIFITNWQNFYRFTLISNNDSVDALVFKFHFQILLLFLHKNS